LIKLEPQHIDTNFFKIMYHNSSLQNHIKVSILIKVCRTKTQTYIIISNILSIPYNHDQKCMT